MQAIGHAQNTQPNSPLSFDQPNTPLPLGQPSTPMWVFTDSIEHAQRTLLSEHAHRTSKNIYKALNFISPSDLKKSSCGWIKISLITMNALFQRIYQLINFIFMCCICKYTPVETMPDLKRNILNFGYRINFKYGGMLVHSFDRLHVVKKLFYHQSMI